MVKKVCFLLSLLFTCLTAQTLHFPLGVSNASIQYRGNPGSNTYYYWVVVNYPYGKSSPTGPYSITNVSTLSSNNIVSLNWTAPTGYTSFDVLRKTNDTTPSGACDCALTIASSTFNFTDQGQSLQTYTVASAALTFPDATTQTTAGVVSGTETATEIGAPLKCSDAGGDDTYTCNFAPVPASLASLAGVLLQVQVATANTGASSFAPNSFTAKAIKKQGGGTDTATGDIIANSTISLVYNATLDVWILQSSVATTPTTAPGGSATQLQYNNAGAFGGMNGTTWADATRELLFAGPTADPILKFTSDPLGDADGNLLYVNFNGISPPSVAGATGTAGPLIEFDGINGGNTSIVTSGTGGDGGNVGFAGGNGGTCPNAVTSCTGGIGGRVQTNAGSGGAATVSGAGINQGGSSSGLSSFSGNGGNAANGGTNTGGDAGDDLHLLGSGGTGATANGTDGTLIVRAGARANANIQEWQLNNATVLYRISSLGYPIGGTGNAPAISGCTSAAIVAGSTGVAGQINTTPTGSCAVTLTFDQTAPTGWNCAISNQTTANLIRQTASTTTTAVFTGVTVANDVLAYGPCVGW